MIDQARLLPLVAREEIWKTGPDAFAASPPSLLDDKGDDQEKLSKFQQLNISKNMPVS